MERKNFGGEFFYGFVLFLFDFFRRGKRFYRETRFSLKNEFFSSSTSNPIF